MNKIEVTGLHFSYGAEAVLRGITLSFDTTPTAIIGQNGAGKTTFVKLLKGLLKPGAGSVVINGSDTRETTVAQLARQIGLVFQNPNDQIFKNTVIDEVMFGPLNIGQSAADARRNSLQALEMVGLSGNLTAHPYDLSLSERKLVSIAAVVAMQNGIIILDEPTIAQDYAGKERIRRIIRDLRAQGRLIITIIHDMDFVAETFERVIVFQDGKVILDGDARTVFGATDLLYRAKLEPPHVTQLCKRLGYRETFLTVEEFIAYQQREVKK
ncbi:energy-coupling factor transport system ATP-binding protein [Hydrogenispora ethanolica]|uniref:Energy-coupling factor transport system ATP-binding protein n=1 Tax=Hydrogenispora ethanolica TaxID=1082276 RepID=A0A4R1RQB0_HYDET|nr:ABC transporter ATP-binding protein [Hydrogenispora ethanolica]TCL68484.1 energy-coupling factor transport system ATP-binding protein [Hydrogenispora ethanolica]